MRLTHIIRQAKAYRTRIQFPLLRGRPAWCDHIEKILVSSYPEMGIDVRVRTGSIVLTHPQGSVNLKQLAALVRSQAHVLETLAPASVSSDSSCFFSENHSISQGHLPGKILAASGLYLAWLTVGHVLFPATFLASGVFSLPFVLTLGLAWPIQKKAVENVKATGKADMSLISTGLLYISLFTGHVLPALAVAWMYNVSAWMEARVKNHARRLVRDMFTGRQTQVFVLVDGVEVSMDIDRVKEGDVLVLHQGQAILVDGTVVKGRILVNEAAMTGESFPVVKTGGDKVLAGTFVEDGQAHVRVEKIGEHTRMAAIIRLIEAGEEDHGQMGKTSLKISQAMVPVSLTLGGLALLLTGSPVMAMTFMMVTCPCALRLSTSTAVSVAISNAASRGILIKGGSHVETAGKVNLVVLDKTGTITSPVPRITGVERLDKRYKEDTILGFAFLVLKTWNHPLGRAIVRKAEQASLDVPACSDRKLFTARGGVATILSGVSPRKVFAGTLDFMVHQKVDVSRLQKFPANEEQSSVYVAVDGHLIGCIHVSHVIRNDVSPDSLKKLRTLGVSSIVLLTGDTEQGTKKTAGLLPFDEVRWAMSPEEKAQWIESCRSSCPHAVIAMAGDGINDTPAFSRADVSFAVGETGEDITLEYADVVLQKGGVDALVHTLEIGQHALRVMKESYAITIGANSLTLALMISGVISPVAGALVHNLITGAAVLNAAKKDKNKNLSDFKRRKT